MSIVKDSCEIQIGGSKSETNRLLLLQALFPQITLINTSDSDDSDVMQKAISGSDKIVDIHHAGTAMRFLTAYFATQENREVILTGSDRMKQRPIKILVEALRNLGADISYLGNDGFPPIQIRGKKLTRGAISIPADVSSQYVSALLLIAPRLENGLRLTLEGEITSMPYIQMTLELLRQISVETDFIANVITVKPFSLFRSPFSLTVESDWSSASYFYSIVALSDTGSQITLSNFRYDSLQGDRALVDIYQNFGVATFFANETIQIYKTGDRQPTTIRLNLNHTPDLAQTIAVTCFALGLGCQLTGLHTLKIKETDRLDALKNELTKLGAKVSVTNDSLTLESSEKINPNITIATYNDHRMAMAFAPLALKVPIKIADAEVVSKSYPNFWNNLKSIGFQISETQ